MADIALPRAKAGKRVSGLVLLMLGIAAFLLIFLLIPAGTVIYVAFTEKGTGALTLVNFFDFFSNDLFKRSFANSLYVSIMSVIWASLFALPLAVITTRFAFRGAVLIQTLGFLPLIMPPFVGAVAMQLLFGRNGTVNLLLEQNLGIRLPFMEGLNGVIFVQSLHYFPFILINVSNSLRQIDSAMEEAAQNMGASGFTLLRKIIFPLAMPGYLAGAALVFVKVFDDLATPLLLNVKDMLAPQAYLRVTSIGLADPMGYVIATILIAVSICAMWGSVAVMRGRDYATVQRGGGGLARRKLKPGEAIIAYSVVTLVLLLVLSPHIGLLLLSFSTIWSFSPLPDGYTMAHYGRVIGESSIYIKNTLIYASSAGLIDVVIGGGIAYLVLRTRLFGRQWLDWAASAALAVPGVVLGIGYLRTFYNITLPNGAPLATLPLMVILALAIRRLPYALRAVFAAMQQISVSLEEAAENLGANKARTVSRIVLPLMLGGLLAGFVTSFATAAVELSATLMLIQSSKDAPIAYGLYMFMQSPSGRGPGAALGVIAVLLVAACTFASHLVIERSQKSLGMKT